MEKIIIHTHGRLETYRGRQRSAGDILAAAAKGSPVWTRPSLAVCRTIASRALVGCLSVLPAFLAGSRWPACSLISPVHAQSTHTPSSKEKKKKRKKRKKKKALARKHTLTRTKNSTTTAAPSDAAGTAHAAEECAHWGSPDNESAAQTTRLLIPSYHHAPLGLPFLPLELQPISQNWR